MVKTYIFFKTKGICVSKLIKMKEINKESEQRDL